MLYQGPAILDNPARPNVRLKRIKWQTWAWAGVLAIVAVLIGWGW